MANLPEWAVAASEEAGVSLEGWMEIGRTVAWALDDPDSWIWVCDEGAIYVEIRQSEKLLCNSFRLADRIKKAILNEPDPRVAELQREVISMAQESVRRELELARLEAEVLALKAKFSGEVQG